MTLKKLQKYSPEAAKRHATGKSEKFLTFFGEKFEESLGKH
jgi:hypothetical protein